MTSIKLELEEGVIEFLHNRDNSLTLKFDDGNIRIAPEKVKGLVKRLCENCVYFELGNTIVDGESLQLKTSNVEYKLNQNEFKLIRDFLINLKIYNVKNILWNGIDSVNLSLQRDLVLNVRNNVEDIDHYFYLNQNDIEGLIYELQNNLEKMRMGNFERACKLKSLFEKLVFIEYFDDKIITSSFVLDNGEMYYSISEIYKTEGIKKDYNFIIDYKKWNENEFLSVYDELFEFIKGDSNEFSLINIDKHLTVTREKDKIQVKIRSDYEHITITKAI